MPRITRRETHQVGKWKITLIYGEGDELLAAELESPRGQRYFIVRKEHVRIKAPKRVLAFLHRHGFQVEQAESTRRRGAAGGEEAGEEGE